MDRLASQIYALVGLLLFVAGVVLFWLLLGNWLFVSVAAMLLALFVLKYLFNTYIPRDDGKSW